MPRRQHGGARVSSRERSGGLMPVKLYGKGYLPINVRGVRGNCTGCHKKPFGFTEAVGGLFLPQLFVNSKFFSG